MEPRAAATQRMEDVPGSALGPVGIAAVIAVTAWQAAEGVGFGDAGELGAAAQTLGVPHPTGFAVDMLWARAWTLLPLGSLAWRQNLGVALAGGVALVLVAEIAARLSALTGVRDRRALRAGAVLAASTLGASPTFLQSARALEVYVTSLCIIAAAALALAHDERRAARWLVPLLGLTPGLHVVTGALCLGMLVFAAARQGPRPMLARLPSLAAGTLVVGYLPLASLRDPPLDWGDPETPAALWAHLSAQRIRDAFASDMLGGDAGAAARFVEQLADFWPLAPLALVGLAWALWRARGAALAVLLIGCADVAYAIWVNPMGIAARQVGHVTHASIAALAGMGAAALVHVSLRHAAWRSAARGLVAALACVVVLGAPRPGAGQAASELLGSAGPLSRLPPRAVLVCWRDDECAGGLFAIHAELARPDVAIAPGQHLWDPTTRRRLVGLRGVAGPAPPPPERNAETWRRIAALTQPQPRPVFWTSREPLEHVGRAATAAPAKVVPYVVLRGVAPSVAPQAAITQLDEYRRVRAVDSNLPEPAAHAWARAYGELGLGALRGGRLQAAVLAYRRCTELAPGWPIGWTNLGTAAEAAGDVPAALAALRRAIELAPFAPTPWVNLARLQRAHAGAEQARAVLESAAEVGVHDGRLEALAHELAAPRAGPTTP